MKRNVGVPLEETDIAEADEIAQLYAERGFDDMKRAAVLRKAIREGLPILRQKLEKPSS